MKNKLLTGRDAVLSVLIGHTIYTLPVWMNKSAAIYAGIVTVGFCVYVLISVNEWRRQTHCAGAKGRRNQHGK